MRLESLQRRYIPITSIVAALFAVAIFGYFSSPEAQEVPARIILDNTGGRVIFAHQPHANEYGYDCTDCHHDDIESDTFLSCGSCHPTEFNDAFRATHQANFSTDAACLRCHDETPEGDIAKEDRPDASNIPLRAEAFHEQCMSCHEEDGGPYAEDSCYQCHAR